MGGTGGKQEAWNTREGDRGRTVKAAQMRMMAANEGGGDLKLRVEPLEGGEEAVDEVAGAGAAAGVVAEADEQLLELPDATNSHGARRGAGAGAMAKGESANTTTKGACAASPETLKPRDPKPWGV